MTLDRVSTVLEMAVFKGGTYYPPPTSLLPPHKGTDGFGDS